MPRTKTLPPTTPAAFLNGFQEQLREMLCHLDRPAALALLTDLGDLLARQRGGLQTLEKSCREMLERATRACSYTELQEIEHALTALETAQFVASGSVPGLQRACTEFRDRLAERTLALLEAELTPAHGPAPLPYALISTGSDGREEQTLVFTVFSGACRRIKSIGSTPRTRLRSAELSWSP